METEEIDLRHYFEILWKWKWAIALLTGVAVLTSAVFSFFVLAPVYETKVTLLVSNAAQNQQSVRPQGDTSVVETVSRIPVMTLNTYMSQITSPYFLKRVIDKLKLSDLDPTGLARMITAQIIKDTNLIEVKVQNTDRVLAATIANTIASEFVEFISESNQERMGKSLAFLAEQKQALKKELETAYANLSKIQSGPDNVTSLTREISAKSQALAKFREDLVRAQLQRDLLEAGIAQLDKDIARTPPTIVSSGADGTDREVQNPAYQDLIKSRSQKVVQLAETNAQIAGLQREIADLQATVAAMEARLTIAQNIEAEAKANVDRLESTLALLDAKMVEAQMAQSLNLGETTISVISPALEPVTPVKPRKVLNMAVAAVLGGFMSVLLAFLLEYLDNTIKTQEDVLKYLNLGTLGAIPLLDQERQRK